MCVNYIGRRSSQSNKNKWIGKNVDISKLIKN